MTVGQARQQLTKDEMEKLTEQALADGPFVIDRIRRLGRRVEAEVSFTTGGKKLIVVSS